MDEVNLQLYICILYVSAISIFWSLKKRYMTKQIYNYSLLCLSLIFNTIPHAIRLTHRRLTVGAIDIWITTRSFWRNAIKCRERRDKRCHQGTAAREPRIRTLNDTERAARKQNAQSQLDTIHVPITVFNAAFAISNTRRSTISDARQITTSDTRHENETLQYTKRLSVRDFSGKSLFTRTTRSRPASLR